MNGDLRVGEGIISGIGSAQLGGALATLLVGDELGCETYLSQMSKGDIEKAHMAVGILSSKLAAAGAVYELKRIGGAFGVEIPEDLVRSAQHMIGAGNSSDVSEETVEGKVKGDPH